MKKRVLETLASIAFVVGVLLLFGKVGYWETHYTTTGRIAEIEKNIIYVETNDGNVWTFEGEGYNLQDIVELTMWTNDTDLNKYDDEIEAVKKIA